ncbi:TIM-barrel domain-containing protein [Flavihumibacter petaseus]|nr:TIM-barrel domain-containing protein [Flavihumibacter petaseus]
MIASLKKCVAPILTVLLACTLFFSVAAQDSGPGYRVTAKGVTVIPARQQGGVSEVQLEVITEKIIRVVAKPRQQLPERPTLSVLENLPATPAFQTENSDAVVKLKTASLIAAVDKNSGQVSFTDLNGKTILAEDPAGRQIQPAVFEGQPLYSVTQTFLSQPAEGYYGLGQHQDDLFDYRNQQVKLWQNNTEVAVPFLVSSNRYGILWDNYSLTTAGNLRAYQPLSALQLTAKTGEKGWLTASYANNRNHPDQVALTRAESVIDIPYLNDSKRILPADFKVAEGQVAWEGKISTAMEGMQQLRFTYAGYIKCYIDGQLMLDRWRQAWNPGSGVVDLDWKKDSQHDIRIEWIPDGGESYLTCRWLPPTTAQAPSTFGFSSEAGRQLDYYFVYGSSIDEVIGGYRLLTGKAPIVPRWALGFWQSRERYKTQDEILSTVKTFREKKIPLDNIVLDWSYWKQADWGSQEFDASRFPNPDSMIKVLHQQYKTRFMISVWPKFYEGIKAYEDFRAKGWLYPRNIADRQRDWIAQGYISTFYDAFNPAARQGFWNLIHDKLYTKGVDAWWMDASEPDILSNVDPGRRKDQMVGVHLGTAAEFLNAYPLQNAKGIYEGQRGVDPDKRVFLLTRSGFLGSQRYGATIWSGDIASRWTDMKAQISAGLNFSLSGLPYWTMDIGGFSVEKRFEQPNATDKKEWQELMTRWFQFGAFAPLFRSHGQFPYREIYNTANEGEPAYNSMLYYNKLRYRLLPYIYSLAGEAWLHDKTLMRALVMDFPDDETARQVGDQFLLGPSLLVNPVYTYGATERNVYLPSGGWFELETGKFLTGGQTIKAAAPYERLPLYVRAGSILPTGPALLYSDEKKADPVTLNIYAGADADFTLYEDDGLHYQYEKGAYTTISFHYDEASRTLTIGDRNGSFPEMLKNRIFRIRVTRPDQPKPLVFDDASDRSVRYSGKQQTIKL